MSKTIKLPIAYEAGLAQVPAFNGDGKPSPAHAYEAVHKAQPNVYNPSTQEPTAECPYCKKLVPVEVHYLRHRLKCAEERIKQLEVRSDNCTAEGYRLSPGDSYALGYNDGLSNLDSREDEIRQAHAAQDVTQR